MFSWEVGKGGVLCPVVSASVEGLLLHGKGGVVTSLLVLESLGESEVFLLYLAEDVLLGYDV